MADEDISRAELRYRELFEEAPLSLWEEDLSGMKEYLDDLGNAGVTDLLDYFTKNPEAFAECVSQGRVLDVNKYTLQLYGAGSKQEFHDNLSEFLSEETYPFLMENLQALADGKQSLEGETVNRTLQGERLDIYLKWIVVPDSLPAYSRVMVTIVDISERKRAEEKLKESERLYHMLADNTKDLMCLCDPQGIRLYVSPSYKNVLGYEPEELLGGHLLSVVHPDELERVSRELEEGMGRSEPGSSRHRIRHKDGHYIWFDSHGTPLLDEEGDLIGGLAVSWNITERVEAEEVLRRERQQLISIFDSINQVIYVSDPATYEVLYVNLAMKDAFGKELVGGQCYREFQGFEEPCDFCTNGIILANHGEPYIWEYHNPLTERDYLIVDRIIAWPPDERDARFELAIDITERKQTEEALQEYNEQLKNFLAVAAHELRHPICLMQGYANTLLDFRQDMPEEMLKEVFDSIGIASRRLTNLVEELLEVSRIEKERFVLDRCATDPERILRQVVEEMRGREVDNPFEVKTAEGVGTWPLDPDKFRQLMVILLDNAVNYSEPGSPVEVEMEKAAEGLSLSVLDRGRGVSADERDQIFQRFYQVEDTRHHSVPGLGLGLYIAREIVEGHGGRIWCEDRPGAGSAFRIILP